MHQITTPERNSHTVDTPYNIHGNNVELSHDPTQKKTQSHRSIQQENITDDLSPSISSTGTPRLDYLNQLREKTTSIPGNISKYNIAADNRRVMNSLSGDMQASVTTPSHVQVPANKCEPVIHVRDPPRSPRVPGMYAVHHDKSQHSPPANPSIQINVSKHQET